MTVDLTSGKTATVSETRAIKFLNRWNMYNDNYKAQVKKRLTEIYIDVESIGMISQIDMTNNIYKTIVEKISRVYTQGVERDFNDDENLKLLYDKARVNKYMKQANKYLNAFNDVLLQVSWDENNGIPKFNFRLPHRTRVATNSFDEVVAVEYFVETLEEGAEKWAFWSDVEHYYNIYTGEGEAVQEAVGDNSEMTNPYGVLPFVIMQNGFRDGNFFDMFSGDDLVNITLDNAIYNTFKNYLIKWQSFKQMVVTGSNVGSLDGQMLDPATALSAEGEDVDIKLLDLQANLTQLVDTIESSSTTVAVNYNISPNQFRMTGQVSSGFALQMENKSLDEFTADQQSDFVSYENDLFNLIIKIGNEHGAKLNENVDFKVEFPPIQYSESMSETLQNYEMAINLALKSPIEIISMLREVDEEEATKIYEENLKIRNQSNEKFNEREPTVTIPISEGS